MQKIVVLLFALLSMSGITHATSVVAERPMVLVITSYNNAPWVEKNLDSVVMQKYDNYRVIYVDDASTDGTAEKVEQYINKHGIAHRVQLIKSPQRLRKLQHLYKIHHAQDEWDIIIRLDGDDWLAHENVLQRVNQEYQQRNAWVTYGTLRYSTPSIGRHNKQVTTNSSEVARQRLGTRLGRREIRGFHLCTSYTWLFKQIKLQELMTENVSDFRGKFHPASDDVAIMYPMMEMARAHCRYISDILYIYNRENPLSGWAMTHMRKIHGINSKEIRMDYPLYRPAVTPRFYRGRYMNGPAVSMFFLTSGREQDQLYVERILKRHNKQLGTLFVVCAGDSPCAWREKVADRRVSWCDLASLSGIDRLVQLLQHDASRYLLMTDAQSGESIADLEHGVRYMDRTFAYGLYPASLLSSGGPIPCQHIDDDMYAWKFFCAGSERRLVHNFAMTLYRKEAVINWLKMLANSALGPGHMGWDSLRRFWKNFPVDKHAVGLISRTVCRPMS